MRARGPTSSTRASRRSREPWPRPPRRSGSSASCAPRRCRPSPHCTSPLRHPWSGPGAPARSGDRGSVTRRAHEFVDLGPAPAPAVVSSRLAALSELILAGASAANRIPAAVISSIVHAEIVSIRPFVHGNGLVARAMERALVQALGLDPTGVAVPEAGHVANGGPAYLGALTAYGTGTRVRGGPLADPGGGGARERRRRGGADQRRGASRAARLKRACCPPWWTLSAAAGVLGSVATPRACCRTGPGATSPRGVGTDPSKQKSREGTEYPRESSSLGTVHPRAPTRGDTTRMHAW